MHTDLIKPHTKRDIGIYKKNNNNNYLLNKILSFKVYLTIRYRNVLS